ncbi:MAG: Cell division protein FtsQ [Rickettsiaceae bacterium]|jgi:cell division protein FtsQ|nr:Cell division protein FtsQ [Rickettsiaceae bacterium]
MWNIKISKIKSFIISRPSVRIIRAFFYNKVFPWFKYSLCFFVALLILVTSYLAIFNKPKFGEIKERLIAYGYRAINFNGSQRYNKIRIDGYNYTNYEQIIKISNEEFAKDRGMNNQKIIQSLKDRIEELPWVDEVVVSISLQDTLKIQIKEHQPFAVWEDNEKKYIVSKTGEIIAVNNINDFDSLIILTGKDAYKNVKSLFNILAIDPEIGKNVYSATWVGGRRWDVRFESGLLVKLPSSNEENDMKEAWDALIKIYNMPGSLIGLKGIDLRIAKKIYLEYDNQTTKEIKSQ